MRRILLIISSISVLLLVGCKNDYVVEMPKYSSSPITFSSPAISYDVDSRSGALNKFPVGGKFGVFGYCVGQDVYGYPDPSSGNVSWDTKKVKCKPDVFFNVPFICNETVCSYLYGNNVKTWYEPKDYLYTFFAYYPYGEFGTGYTPIMLKTSKDTYGEPSVNFTMPFSSGNIETDELDYTRVPDVMMAAKFDMVGYAPVDLKFSHALTCLKFRINNLNPTAGLTIHSLKLEGSFYKSIDIKFNGNYDLLENEKYEGFYHLIKNDTDVAPDNAYDTESLLLICNIFPQDDNDYLGGKDIRLVIDYTFDGSRDSINYERPSSFAPKSGTRYTAMLNFVGDTFVLQVLPEDVWETGSDDNIKFE